MSRRPPLRCFADEEIEALARRLRAVDHREGSLMTEAAIALRSMAAERRKVIATLEKIAAGLYPLPIPTDAAAWIEVARRRKQLAQGALRELGRP